MAGMAGACVVPVILWQERRWRFGLAFGPPLDPPDGSTDSVKRIAEACVTHWVPVIKRYPEQYTYLDHRIWTPALESGETPTA